MKVLITTSSFGDEGIQTLQKSGIEVVNNPYGRKITQTEAIALLKDIDGVIFTPLKIISMTDGDILHGMKISEEGYQGFGEAYFSSVHHNSIKGWKRHFKMVLNMVVPIGKIRFVLFDDRKKSTTFGYFQEIIM